MIRKAKQEDLLEVLNLRWSIFLVTLIQKNMLFLCMATFLLKRRHVISCNHYLSTDAHGCTICMHIP